MKRTFARLLLLIILASSSVSAAANHKVFRVATSANPIVIAVLADHYTDESKFDNDVANFITYGLLANPYYAGHAGDFQIETFYEPVAAGIASNYGFNVEAPSANCLLSWEIGNTATTNTWAKVSAVVGGINPKHTIVIGDHPYSIGCTEGEWTYVTEDAAGTDMLSHEFGHGIGQLHDEWSLARNLTLPHPGMSGDPEVARNCHHLANGPTPPWTFPGAGARNGCNLYGLQIVHAYDHMTVYGSHSYCLMGATSNAEFCPVCKHYMDQEFALLDLPNPDIDNPDVNNPDVDNPDPHNPPPPPPPGTGVGSRAAVPSHNEPANPGFRKPIPPRPQSRGSIVLAAFGQSVKSQSPPPTGTAGQSARQPERVSPPLTLLPVGSTGPIVRLIVGFNPENGQLTAKKALPINARYAPNQRRFGDYAYEVLNGDQVLGVGVIPSNLSRTHDYQGGAAHRTSPPHLTDITLQMPGITAEMLKDTSRNITIRVWWLSQGVTNRVITINTLTGLRQKNLVELRGLLTAEQIRGAL